MFKYRIAFALTLISIFSAQPSRADEPEGCEAASRRNEEYAASARQFGEALAKRPSEWGSASIFSDERSLDSLFKRIVKATEVGSWDREQLVEANRLIDLYSNRAQESYLPAANRQSVLAVYHRARDLVASEILATPGLDRRTRAQMAKRVRSTQPLFIDDATPEIPVEHRALLNYSSYVACGTRYNVPAIQAFYFPGRKRSYVMICPGILFMASRSPQGADSLLFVFAHEIAHAIDTSAAFDIPIIAKAIQRPRYPAEYQPLLRCWKDSLGNQLLSPGQLMGHWHYRAQIDAYRDQIRMQREQFGTEPTAIEMHSPEMVSDYWATRVLRKELSTLTADQARERKNENLLLFCPAFGNDDDNGLHLPAPMRRAWILSGLQAQPDWCEL